MFLKYSAKGTSPVPSAHPWAFLGFLRVIVGREWIRVRTPGYSVGKISCVGDEYRENEDGKRLDSLKKGSGLFVFIYKYEYGEGEDI